MKTDPFRPHREPVVLLQRHKHILEDADFQIEANLYEFEDYILVTTVTLRGSPAEGCLKQAKDLCWWSSTLGIQFINKPLVTMTFGVSGAHIEVPGFQRLTFPLQ